MKSLNTAMQLRGKVLILLIFSVAVAMSGYAWWHQYQAGRRSVAFWGRDAALLVRYGREVQFIPVRPADEASEPSDQKITIEGAEYTLRSAVDVSNSRGMVHVRHALVDDMSFDWESTPANPQRWDFLLRFGEKGRYATAAFETKSGRVFFVEQARVAHLIPKIANAFRQKELDWTRLAPPPK